MRGPDRLRQQRRLRRLKERAIIAVQDAETDLLMLGLLQLSYRAYDLARDIRRSRITAEIRKRATARTKEE